MVMMIHIEQAYSTGKGEKYWETIKNIGHGKNQKINRNRKQTDRFEERHAADGPEPSRTVMNGGKRKNING